MAAEPVPFSDREAVLGLSIGTATARVKAVAVPGLGAPVFVRQLTIGEYQRLGTTYKDDPAAATILLAACDSSGRRLFVDDDLPSIKRLPAALAVAIVQAADEINALDADSIEDAAKN